MQDNLMQAQTQPFVKLAQANMDLVTRFSTSPEVTAQASANVGSSSVALLYISSAVRSPPGPVWLK